MPTGYTAIIEDEPNCTFEDYLWRCARAFGSFIHMRDHSLGSRLVLKDEQDVSGIAYHTKELREAEAEVVRLKALTPAECEAEAAKCSADSLKSAEERYEHNKVLLAKYARIREQVVAWEPPSPDHEGLKKFMIEQIVESTKYEEEARYPFVPPEPMTGPQWLAIMLDMNERSVGYHTRDLEKAQEGNRSANAWVRALMAAVPIPEKVSPR